MDDYNRSAANKEDFFNRQRERNAAKPEGVRPSEGGKYVGFGSGAAPAPRRDDPMEDLLGTLGTGLSSITQQLGRVAVQTGRVAGETLGSAGRAAHQTLSDVQAGDMDQVQARAAGVAQKGVEMGQKTWSGLKSMLRAGVSQLETLTGEEGGFGGPANRSGSGGRGGGDAGWGGWDAEDDAGWGVGGGGGGGSGGGEPSREAYERSAAGKEAFFARKREENASRRDDVPPSRSTRGSARVRASPARRWRLRTGPRGGDGRFGGWDAEDDRPPARASRARRPSEELRPPTPARSPPPPPARRGARAAGRRAGERAPARRRLSLRGTEASGTPTTRTGEMTMTGGSERIYIRVRLEWGRGRTES